MVPKLPRKNKRVEADLDAKVAKRVSQVYHCKNWALEVKVGKNKILKHQENALQKVEDGKFLYKLPDMGKRNPFDYIRLGDADAIVCTVADNKRDVSCVVNGHYTFKCRI